MIEKTLFDRGVCFSRHSFTDKYIKTVVLLLKRLFNKKILLSYVTDVTKTLIRIAPGSFYAFNDHLRSTEEVNGLQNTASPDIPLGTQDHTTTTRCKIINQICKELYFFSYDNKTLEELS